MPLTIIPSGKDARYGLYAKFNLKEESSFRNRMIGGVLPEAIIRIFG